MSDRPRIFVLAGVNGAGKSSIGGAAIRASGADYYNPDEAARVLMASQLGLTLAEANAAAWQIGRTLLERAIQEGLDFAFETTLGGNTIPRLLGEAAKREIETLVWYVASRVPNCTSSAWRPASAGVVIRFRRRRFDGVTSGVA